MSMQQETIDRFYTAIAPHIETYTDAVFCFLAVKADAKYKVAKARISFRNGESIQNPFRFESENIMAGYFSIGDAKDTAKKFTSDILNGCIKYGDLELCLPDENLHLHSFYDPFHPDGIRDQAKLDYLSIRGGYIRELQNLNSLNWEVRGAEVPYDSVQELMYDIGLGSIEHDFNFEVFAPNIIVVDYLSAVEAEVANLTVRTVKGVDPHDISVGYRVINNDKVVSRAKLEGRDFSWTDEEIFKKGIAQIGVPKASRIQCFASYKGVVQHFGWIGDPKSFPNPKRAVYGAFDPGGLSPVSETPS